VVAGKNTSKGGFETEELAAQYWNGCVLCSGRERRTDSLRLAAAAGRTDLNPLPKGAAPAADAPLAKRAKVQAAPEAASVPPPAPAAAPAAPRPAAAPAPSSSRCSIM